MDREERAAYIILSMPDERTLEQTDEDICDVLERWQAPNETTFGFCAQVRLCSCDDTRSFGIGCPHLVPNPANRLAIIKWREVYAERARELESRGAMEDARQARSQVQKLDDLIRIMDLVQQAINDGTYTPPFIFPPGHGEDEEHLDT